MYKTIGYRFECPRCGTFQDVKKNHTEAPLQCCNPACLYVLPAQAECDTTMPVITGASDFAGFINGQNFNH